MLLAPLRLCSKNKLKRRIYADVSFLRAFASPTNSSNEFAQRKKEREEEEEEEKGEKEERGIPWTCSLLVLIRSKKPPPTHYST